jgi:hypothetical protein
MYSWYEWIFFRNANNFLSLCEGLPSSKRSLMPSKMALKNLKFLFVCILALPDFVIHGQNLPKYGFHQPRACWLGVQFW